MTETIKGAFATAIGSMPHSSPDSALDLVLSTIPEAPCWPQLPRLGRRERMVDQFSEGLPALRPDPVSGDLRFGAMDDDMAALERFYESYLACLSGAPCDAFSISEPFAAGLHTLLARLGEPGTERRPFIKCPLTGPLTFGLSVLDGSGRPAIYDETLADVIVKGLSMKGRWEVELFRPYADRVIVFMDEPILGSYGTAALIGVSKDLVTKSLGEVAEAVRSAGGLVGAHCCANTDWSLFGQIDLDILSFDAYSDAQSLALFPGIVSALFDRGGALAWGIVPTSDRIDEEDAGSLLGRLRLGMSLFEEKGVDRALLAERLIVTPSCGTGTMDESGAEKVFHTLSEVAGRLDEL